MMIPQVYLPDGRDKAQRRARRGRAAASSALSPTADTLDTKQPARSSQPSHTGKGQTAGPPYHATM